MQIKSDKKINMKLISWNLNGIRAVAKKGLNQLIYEMDPDIIGFQETKAQDHQVKEALIDLEGYNLYANSAEKKGYSGTAVLSKTTPLNVIYGIGIKEFDNEGRVLTLEFENFYFTTVYVPNSGGELLRLEYRKSWDKEFLTFLKEMEVKKPVIVCGDFNVAHKEIDLKNPKSNYNKSSGYMQDEIDGMDNFINAGFQDTFRYFNPDLIKYSWWSYRFNSRARNIGWRIDYLLTSEKLIDSIKDTFILNDVLGSDHCPVGIEL